MNMLNMESIMVGITTYNRKEILDSYAKAFNNIVGIEKVHVCIFDDASTEYDRDYLCSIFPMAAYVHINNKNMGADRNTRQLYEYFSRSEYDWLLNADSDLIFNSNILEVITSIAQNTQGIFSVFNTPAHPTISVFDNIFVEKEHVGAAGVVVSRELVGKILCSIPQRDVAFDWDFSSYIRSKNLKLLVTKQSFCQHIGFSGQNSRIHFDYGENFCIDNLDTANIIENIFENIFCGDYYFIKSKLTLKEIMCVFKYIVINYLVHYLYKNDK